AHRQTGSRAASARSITYAARFHRALPRQEEPDVSGPDALAAVIFFGGAFWVLRPTGAAIAKRIAGEHRKPGMDAADRGEIPSQLHAVREEVAELAERMDFAERMLAKPKNG